MHKEIKFDHFDMAYDEPCDAFHFALCAYLFLLPGIAGISITTESLAKKFKVSTYTILRWLKGMAADETFGLNILRPDSETLVLSFKTKFGQDRSSSPLPPTPPILSSEFSFSLSESSRYESATAILISTQVISKRIPIGIGNDLVAKMVRLPLLSKVDLAKEIADADAWLVQSRKPYKNMTRYLMNWMRSASKKGSKSNANRPPSDDKYSHLHGGGKPRPLSPGPVSVRSGGFTDE